MTNELTLISNISSQPNLTSITTKNSNPKTEGADFSSWVSSEMMTINNQINKAELNVRELAAGKADNLHHVMTSLSKAKLSFELAVEVRNKLLEGYQEIIKMQI